MRNLGCPGTPTMAHNLIMFGCEREAKNFALEARSMAVSSLMPHDCQHTVLDLFDGIPCQSLSLTVSSHECSLFSKFKITWNVLILAIHKVQTIKL
jgi:hypothetical protein